MRNQISLKNKSKRDAKVLFYMALPCIIFIFIFSYLPLRGWIYSLYDYTPGIPLFENEFVGFKHFIGLFGNEILRSQMIRVMRNTFIMAGLGFLFSPLPVIFAVFLNEIKSNAMRRVVQSLATLPHFISWVIMYSLVFFMLSTGGFVNNIMMSLGLRESPVNYMISTSNVWLTMSAYQIWKGLGWGAIVYLAAIAGIDQEQYEAAIIDGAGRFQRIWYITVPGIIPTFFVLLILSIGDLLSVGFDQFYVFQNAMNKSYIEVLDLYVYNQGIGGGNISYATAVGVMKTVVAVVLFTFANSLSKAVRGHSIF